MKPRPLATPPRPETGSHRLLPSTGAVPVLLAEHLDQHGPLPYLAYSARGKLAAVLSQAGLVTRDSSARPVRLSPAEPSQPLTATAVSRKDHALIWLAPHLVLDGIQLVSLAIRAPRAHLEIPKPGGNLHSFLRKQLAARLAAWLDVIPVTLPGDEEPAAGPRLDTETLAHIALIARYGPSWFRSVGTRERPGTELREVLEPGGDIDVVEVPGGSRTPRGVHGLSLAGPPEAFASEQSNG